MDASSFVCLQMSKEGLVYLLTLRLESSHQLSSPTTYYCVELTQEEAQTNPKCIMFSFMESHLKCNKRKNKGSEFPGRNLHSKKKLEGLQGNYLIFLVFAEQLLNTKEIQPFPVDQGNDAFKF